MSGEGHTASGPEVPETRRAVRHLPRTTRLPPYAASMAQPAKPKFPTQARLGPFVYRITEDPADWTDVEKKLEDLHGYTDNEQGTIYINPVAQDVFKRVILLHELMHAAVFASGGIFTVKWTEEQWVQATAPLLLDALQRSPDLAAYLLQPEG